MSTLKDGDRLKDGVSELLACTHVGHKVTVELAGAGRNFAPDESRMAGLDSEKEPTTCFLCHAPLPSDLKFCTMVDGKFVHMNCFEQLNTGRIEGFGKRKKKGRGKRSESVRFGIPRVLQVIRHEKVSEVIPVKVQLSLKNYLKQIAEKQGVSAWVRETIIMRLRWSQEESL